MARKLASMPTTSEMKKNRAMIASSGFSPRRYTSYKKRSSGSNKVLRFGGGSALRKQQTYKKRTSSGFLSNLRRKKTSKSHSAKVMRFAKRAQEQAQISTNKERPIFDIISRRYKVSGWKRLEVQ